MDGEQETIAEIEQETPANDPEVEAEQPVNLDDAGNEPEVEEEPQPEEEEFEEFDWNGKKVKGPKGLKDGLMMQADYTKKTQEVAATRKELEQRAERLNQQFAASDEYLDARADLRTITKELERFKEFDWSAYQQARLSDPLAADEAWNYAQHLRGQKANLEAAIQDHEGKRTAEAQQEIAKRMQETSDYVKANLKGWTPETDKQVIDFALSKGVTREQMQSLMNPLMYEMIYLARIGQQTLSKPAPAAKQTAKPAPLQVVGGRSTPAARKSLGEMSMEEYAAARKAGRGN
jgi:hypothetical protein